MSTYLRCAVLFAVLACATAHAEKKIYACKDAAGNAIFSPDPCGKDAKELHVDAGAPPTQVVVDPAAKKASAAAAPADALRDISDSVADSTCRRDAQNALYYPSDGNLLDLERRKGNIIQQAGYANNNLAGAVWEQGLRKQIGDMEIAIQQERSRLAEARDRADAVRRQAIADCDMHKSERERTRAEPSGH
jgi:hypothetical protein